LEYISAKGTLVVADDEGLVAALAEQGALEAFSADITESVQAKSTNLNTLIKKYGLWTPKGISSIEAYRVKKEYKLDETKKPSIRQFIRTTNNAPYIPGSSIKGAIRTALLYSYLKKIKEENDRYFYNTIVPEYVKALQKTPQRKMKRAARFFEGLFQSFSIGNASRYGPNTDIMRAVHISDTIPLDKNALELKKVHIFNKKYQPQGKRTIAIHLECISPETSLSFSCSIDKNVLEHFEGTGKELPFKNEKGITSACETFSKDLIEYEKTYFESIGPCSSIYNYYSRCNANIRIGTGSGLVANTIYLLIPENKREMLKKAYPHYSQGMPTSRKVVMDNETISAVLGWGRIY